LIGAAIGAFVLLAWLYMAREARTMNLTGVCQCAGMKMSGPDITSWSLASLPPLFLMWTEMMVAMMLPSAAPMILIFAEVNRKRFERREPFVSTSIFAAGYLAAWTGFSLIAAVAQWALHAKAFLSPTMSANSPAVAGCILLAAGAFQWSPLKQACLRHCRSPLDFIMTQWRDGSAGAFLMGLRHGAYCTGCCWFLMALLFVAGVMNMWWIGIIALLVLIEKVAPKGPLVARITGLILGVWGLILLLRS
jgi:predicted metal-binding membrane protein